MKQRRGSFLTFVIAAVLAVSLLVSGAAFALRIPKNGVVEAAEGGTVTRTARSYTNDCWYFGDSLGNVVKTDASGEEVSRLALSPGRKIVSLASNRNLDCLLVLDEDNAFFRITDGETGLTSERIGTFAGGWISVAADEDSVYFAVNVSRYIDFVRYAKDGLGGEPTGRGRLYLSSRSGERTTFLPVKSSTLVCLEAEGGYLFALTGEGLYQKMSVDFALNRFPFMTEEEREAVGAEISSDGTVVIPTQQYDSAKYRTVRSQVTAKSAAYDAAEKRFYIAGADEKLYTFSDGFAEDKERTLALASVPASGALALHPESGTLYVGYENLSAVTAVDTASNRVLYQSDTAFYISGMTVAEKGNRLLVLCSANDRDNPDLKQLLSVDIAVQAHRNLFSTLGTTLLIAGILTAVAALFAGLSAFREGFREGLFAVLRDVGKNWIVYLIIVGSLTMLILFCYYPGISSMVLSFFDYTQANPTMRFNNFQNYIDIFTRSESLIAFRNMLIFLASDIVIAIAPPMLFAICLSFMRNKTYSTFSRIVLFLPSVLPGIATLLIWKRGIYGIDGVLNLFLRTVSGNPEAYVPFLENYGIPSLIFMGFPFVGSYLIFYGALMNVPSSYYEAAELDGCSIPKRIFRIEIPMIAPQIKYVFILAFIGSVQNFSRVLMTTDGRYGTQIPIVLMYKKLQSGDLGVSSAYATLMFLVLIVATVFNMKIQTGETEV